MHLMITTYITDLYLMLQISLLRLLLKVKVNTDSSDTSMNSDSLKLLFFSVSLPRFSFYYPFSGGTNDYLYPSSEGL